MLMSAAHGMVNNGSPWACSGQNQGYRKSLYNRIGGFNKIANQIQGDDTLFMLLCRKFGKAKFAFSSLIIMTRFFHVQKIHGSLSLNNELGGLEI